MTQAALIVAFLFGLFIAARLALVPPPLDGRRQESHAIAISDRTSLGRAVLAAAADHPGTSGVVPLHDGIDAFGARVALIREAEESLDLQYYIWQRDATGLQLLVELHRAAERGVRIRLLLDDNGTAGLDRDLAALNALPTVQVRLFNPFVLRWPKTLNFAWDFMRLNRRMHNKSLIADGAAAILGGRNVGDVYFSYGTGPHYLDTDVLALGPVAGAAGADFDGYWASASAYPAELILPPAPEALSQTAADAAAARAGDEAAAFQSEVMAEPLARDLAEGRLELEWVPVTLISDDPAKGLGRARGRDMLFWQLMRLISRPERGVDIISAYFVPGRRFTERLVRLEAEGMRVRVLTNSQEATDVVVVHSAYVKYRPALLDGGVALYELRATPAAPREPRTPGTSSRSALHSKTVVIDRERIFIGSFNFDPRSVQLNTEMGVLIESPRIAAEVAHGLDEVLPWLSYGPRRADNGRIVWHQPAVGKPETVHLIEPGTSRAQRALLWLLGRLPIEWLL